MIRLAVERIRLTTRAYHRMLKLTRTIADLAACKQIQAPHLADGTRMRPLTKVSGSTSTSSIRP